MVIFSCGGKQIALFLLTLLFYIHLLWRSVAQCAAGLREKALCKN